MTAKQKIILINPPLFYSAEKPHALDASVPPLGLLYLATYINKNSEQWQAYVLDIGSEKQEIDDTMEYIKSKNPLVVGITGMTPQLQGVVELAQKIKIRFPGIKIALGGPHISGDPGFIDRFSDIFDFAITGEGELTLLEILNQILEGKKIKNLYAGETLKNLDELPMPDKTLVDRKKYADHESMMASRGCPFNCYYCSRPAIDRLIRYRSPDSIIEEIKQMYPYCKGVVHFQDDTISANREKLIDLCKKISESGLKIKWQCNTRIDLIDEELLSYMGRAGCELINFGIESGNERIRKEIINKPFTNEDIKKALTLCRKCGIKAAAYFMLGHPGETLKTLRETKNAILKNNFYMVGISIPTPFPGSKLYKISEETGIINKNILDNFALKKLGEGYAGNYPLYIPEGFTKEKLLAIRRQYLRKFYLRPRFIISKILKDITSWRSFKQDIRDGLSVILKGSSSRQPYKDKKNSRVVIVSPFFAPNIGGLETHLLELTDYLKKKDVEATVITYKPLMIKANYKKYEKSGSIEIRRTWWFGHNWFEKLARIPFLEFLYITPGLLFSTFCHSVKNRKKILCFHAHGLAAGFIIRIVSLIIRRKKVLSTHFIYNLKDRPLFSKILIWVFKDFDFIFPVGEDAKEELIKAGLDRNKMKPFKQWVNNKELFVYDKNKKQLRKKLNLPEGKTIILFVGRLLEMKGVSHLIKLAAQNSDLVFVFIGSGILEEKLQKAGFKYSNIIYVGKKFGSELVDFYNASDMLALPSTEEGSSLVVVEALSCGKPVIVTNRGCSKDMFPDDLGKKIDPNPENILLAIRDIEKKLKDNPDLEQKCRNFALNNYSDANAEKIIEQYKLNSKP